jgi:competence protein ComEC
VLNKEVPFLRIAVPLCLGIISGVSFAPGNMFFIASGTLILILFCISLFFNRQLTNHFFGFSLMLALFLCGLFLYTLEKTRLSVLDSTESLFYGRLDDYPEEKENSWRMIFRMEESILSGRKEKVNGSLLIYCRKGEDLPSFTPGDRLVIRCTPQEIASRGNPHEFDYRLYMENNGIKYFSFIDNGDIIFHSSPDFRKPAHRALIVRQRIISMFRERGIEGDRLALVAAITLGQKSLLDPEQKQHFIKAGVMHIMAVSGLHAVILSMFIFRILFFLKGRFNIIRIIVTIVTLWIFAFITGLTPSVLRAAIMYSFLQAGNAMKRPVNGINSVLASAFVLIIAKPSVIFDAGFQLSYAAVIYIILFYRQLYLKIQFSRRIPDLVWQSAAVTIIAQAGTLPLTVMLFNRFPTWFIISNIIIVPLSSIVVILGFMFPMTYPLAFLSRLIAWLLDFTTGLTEHLTEIASELPFSSIENIGITGIECVFLTIAVFLFTKYLLDRKSISVLYPLVAILLFSSAVTAKEISAGKSAELIVFNSINAATTGIRNGKDLIIISDSLPAGQEVSRHAAVLNLRVVEQRPERDVTLLKVSGKNILITNTLSSYLLEAASPDIVILTGEKPRIERNIIYKVYIEAIIVSSEVSGSYRIPASAGGLNAGKVHYAEKEGAFFCRL